MAANFIQPGAVLSLTAPYDVAPGAGFLVGSLFAVAQGSAALGEAVEGATEGVWSLAKAGSQAWTQGAKIYWDNTAKVCTSVATGNTLIGVATAAVGNGAGETTGPVRLGAVL